MLRESFRLALISLLLGGCASVTPVPGVYAQDSLKSFAFELGRTHRSIARCPEVASVQLDAHLASARLALHGQSGPRLVEVTPAFEAGLQATGGPSGSEVPCNCANAVVTESRLHNLRLYRQVALPQAYARAH